MVKTAGQKCSPTVQVQGLPEIYCVSFDQRRCLLINTVPFQKISVIICIVPIAYDAFLAVKYFWLESLLFFVGRSYDLLAHVT